MWKPSVTVAAVIERDGSFLLVEERIDGRLVLNQPAGHLDPGESLAAACRREVLEETAHHFEPDGAGRHLPLALRRARTSPSCASAFRGNVGGGREPAARQGDRRACTG